MSLRLSFAEETSVYGAGVADHTPERIALPRSRGALRLSFKRHREKTVLGGLYQQGCLRARLPRSGSGNFTEAVIMNTSGGLTGGDRLAVTAEWRPATSASICGQAAEKIYRALSGAAEVSNVLHVGPASAAEWLPQETILFNGAGLKRSLDVHLHDSSSFLGIESIVFGRTAMGEEVVSGHIRDAWRIIRGGRLVYADIFRLSGAISEQLNRPAIGAGARAFATIIYTARSVAQDLLDELREVLAHARGRAAASLWNGILATRFIARDGEVLRHDITQALNVLRSGRALPRVWQC
jgi:urease accessory protein